MKNKCKTDPYLDKKFLNYWNKFKYFCFISLKCNFKKEKSRNQNSKEKQTLKIQNLTYKIRNGKKFYYLQAKEIRHFLYTQNTIRLFIFSSREPCNQLRVETQK